MAKKKTKRGAKAARTRKPVRFRPVLRGHGRPAGRRKRGLTLPRPRKKPARVAAPRRVKARRPVRRPQQTRPVTRSVLRAKQSIGKGQSFEVKYRLALIRKHVKGFSASDGYDLRLIKDWSSKKIERVLILSGKLKELLASPHDLKNARTQKARKNLKQFTGQSIRGQKHFIVHKPSDRTRVFLRNGNVEIQGRFHGGVITRSRFFLFPRRPRYPKELVLMARRMLKSMPEGFYTVLTSAHGDTGEPFDKGQLINKLQEYLAAYEVDEAGRPTGFSDAVLGFRFMSTTLGGAEVQRAAVSARRERQRKINKQKYKAAKKKIAKKKLRGKNSG